jgi:hypothetical protein
LKHTGFEATYKMGRDMTRILRKVVIRQANDEQGRRHITGSRNASSESSQMMYKTRPLKNKGIRKELVMEPIIIASTENYT